MRIEERSNMRARGGFSPRRRLVRSRLAAGVPDRPGAPERDFVADMIHEMRTSMAAIRSDTEIMLLDEGLHHDDVVRLKRIVTNVDLLAVAVDTARNIANNAAGASEKVDLAASLAAVWQSLKWKAHAAALTLEDRVPPGITYAVSRSGLLTVLSNLIRNAIDHAAPATLIVSPIDGGLEFRDNGKGVDPGKLSSIFDRGHTAKRPVCDAEGASFRFPDGKHGLGLSIVKRVCDLNGWVITADLIGDGKGVVFKLRFRTFCR